MLFSTSRKTMLAAVLTGLFLSGCTTTTEFNPFGRREPAPIITLPAPAGTQVPQAGIPSPDASSGGILTPLPSGGQQSGLPPLGAGGAAQKVRVALLLPLRSLALARAATSVRDGFMAAHGVDKRNIVVTVADTGDTPQDILSVYDATSANADIIVGPMTRSAVTAMIQGNAVRKPTIVLAQPDLGNAATFTAPPGMLVAALSVEDEARQIAERIASQNARANVIALSTSTAWQRRAAKAFVTEATNRRLDAQVVELNLVSGFLDGAGLAELRKRIRAEKPEMVFVALDFDQTRQLRDAIGMDVPLFGTSQLNPLARADFMTSEPLTNMNGTQLLDIPWQLQPDHPTVRIYPRTTSSPEVRRSADIERLYALGIDAYRIAANLAAQNTRFEMDGVTGRLTVNYGIDSATFQRRMQPAVYQDGMVVPTTGAR